MNFVFLLVIHAVICERMINQTAVGGSTNMIDAFLDNNSQDMVKGGFYTQVEVANFRFNSIIFLSLVSKTLIKECEANVGTGIVECTDITFYPFSASYTVTLDTAYPERVNNWIMIEYGFAGLSSSNLITQVSKLVYYDPNNTANREVLVSYTTSMCPLDFLPTQVVYTQDDSMMYGSAVVAYQASGGVTTIKSSVTLKKWDN